MTTVAFDGVTLASDSQVTEGNIKCGTVQKVFKLPDGSLFAGAGSARELNLAYRYLKGLLEGRDVEKPEMENFQGVLVKNGKILIAEASFSWFEVKAKKYAIGSGSDLALAAMACGKTAVEAVKIAMEYDIYSSGRVQWKKVQPKKKSVKRKKVVDTEGK